MQAEFPPLRQLLADERERTNFVAFASESYSQRDVLFLCAVHDFGTSTNPGDLAQAIYDEYLHERAPHAVTVSSATRKAVEKGLKKKVDRAMFDAAAKEVEQSLSVYREYEPRWLKERKIDTARRQLIGEIDFDLQQPPPLAELLERDKCTRQLRVFAESIFCEEIVLFYVDATAWKRGGCDLAQGRRVCNTYVSTNGVMCLNLEHDVREAVVKAFAEGATSVDPDVFADCLYAVTHQMQQNLYFQFLAHLRAIRKDLQSREKLESLQRALACPRGGAPAPDTVFVPPTFEEVVRDPILLHDLLSFAGRVYSQERVVFFVLIQDFKVQTSDAVRAQMAEKLFAEYIDENSKRQVSLEGRRLAQITSAYRDLCAAGGGVARGIPPTFFDAVEKEVGRSIRNEIFDRFVQFQKAAWEKQLQRDVTEAPADKDKEKEKQPSIGKNLLSFLKKK